MSVLVAERLTGASEPQAEETTTAQSESTEVQLFSHGTILLWVSQQGVDHIQAHKFPLLLQLASNTICSNEKLFLVIGPLDVDRSSSGQFSF